MKESTFMNNIQTIKNWERDNVLNIDLAYISKESSATQVRQDGTDSTHIQQLSHSVVMFGQKVPITVEIFGQRQNGTTKYRIVDGNHRFATLKRLNKENPNDARYYTIKVFIKDFKDDFERLTYQTNANSHETPSKLSTIGDALVVLKNIINNGLPGAPHEVALLHGSAGRNLSEPASYERDLKKATNILFKGLSSKQRTAVVRNLQGKELPGKFARWTASNLRDEFTNWFEFGGRFLNNDFLHSVKNHNYVDWQLIARVFASRSDDSYAQESNNENIVVMYWADISGKNNTDLDAHRRKMLKLINKRNNSWFLKSFRRKRVKLIDRVYIAPQKRDLSCEESGFWEVQKNTKGDFSLTKIPTKGWDTSHENNN
jgi:hypothetical protein